MAALSEATGQTARATALTDRARRVSLRPLTRLLPALAEKEQGVILRFVEMHAWHAALSLGLRHAADQDVAERSAAWLLNGKGLAQQILAQATLLTRDSRHLQLRELSQRLLQTRQELARLTLAPSTNDLTEQRQRRLDELSQREQDLAKQLRQAGGASGAAPWIDLAPLR